MELIETIKKYLEIIDKERSKRYMTQDPDRHTMLFFIPMYIIFIVILIALIIWSINMFFVRLCIILIIPMAVDIYLTINWQEDENN